MAKRRADKQIHKDDPDVDDEEEESGEFEKADDKVLANRVIRKASRRSLNSSSSAPSPLANFAGFSNAPVGAPFSFFGKPNTTSEEKPAPKAESKDSTKSMDALKLLNLSCSSWIRQHLEQNPYVVLLPVFRDYEKHLASLKFDTGSSATSTTAASTFMLPTAPVTTAASSTFSSESKTIPAATITNTSSFGATKPTFSFGVSSEKPDNTFKFGAANSKAVSSEKPDKVSSFGSNESSLGPLAKASAPFSFGSSSNKSEAPSFGFGSAKPSANSEPANKTEKPSFSFGLNNGGLGSSMFDKIPSSTFAVQPPLAAAPLVPPTSTDNEGEASDEPPNSNFVPVGEDGSVYDIRCKVFFKKDGSFNSIGVGTLFLKPVAGGKTQLITRADTAQGSVLLNLLLTPDLPLQRTGKNNVLVVCVPTPDAKPPPVPVLLRVKSEEERDRLLSEMERLRKA